MTSLAPESVLLIGDTDQQLAGALHQAAPGAQITAVATYFDGLAELVAKRYTTVMAAAEPIERRPEAAMKTLRAAAGEGRVVLFGHPTLEPLSRKMLSFGADDYVITPANSGELAQIFGAPPLRLAIEKEEAPDSLPVSPPSKIGFLSGIPLTEIVLDAMLAHPQGGAAAAVKQIASRIAPAMQLTYTRTMSEPADVPEGSFALSHAVRVSGQDVATLHLVLPKDEEESAGRHFLAQIAHVVGKMAALEERHVRLQKLAITDDLTDLANSRYFKHFLGAMIEKAKAMRFPVTLLLFDIDGFKQYNDKYGHGMGDDILRETAALMRRCVRDHDLVARLGGDEFAVVFWEKEGPRVPRDPKTATSARVPQTPMQIFERFRKLIASPEFVNLGASGRGCLTISGAMAVYPYDAQDAEGLIRVVDEELVFGAKQSGKNCLRLVGEESAPPAPLDD
ncbi:MAG TPA: GGDEF domain-containing protein [Tepidisphaeraceae bacterium]|jgi:diguanylate cyclase (GGDEF)-like protein